MNMIQKLTVAALPLMWLAAPAFAQDKRDASEAVPDKMEQVDIKADDITTADDGTVTAIGDPVILRTPEQIITATKGKMIVTEDETEIYGDEITTKSKMVKDKIMPEMDEPTASTPVITEVACPAGTTAQDNGSCMITGDYQE